MMTYAAFGLIVFILIQPLAIIHVVRGGDVTIHRMFSFSRITQPKGFWSVIGIVIAWLIATDLLLVVELFKIVRAGG